MYEMCKQLFEPCWPVCVVLYDKNDAKTPELRDKHWQKINNLLPAVQLLQMAMSVMYSETWLT